MQSCESCWIQVNSNSENLEKNGIFSNKTNTCNSVDTAIGKILSICMKLFVGSITRNYYENIHFILPEVSSLTLPC